MTRIQACWLAILSLPLGSVALLAAPEPEVAITAAPEHPIIEMRDADKFLNFDMMVANRSKLSLRIAKIEVGAYDAGGHLALRKALNTDAFAPSIAVIGNQMLAPGATLDVFNPFSQFEAQMPLNRLDLFLLPAARGYAGRARRQPAPAARRLRFHQGLHADAAPL